MAKWDALKATFFEESSELLEDMEAGLTDIRDGSGSEDTVHAVFRAVHSIKGGAGVFGFETLVGFAHVFETVLDSVRRGSLDTSPAVVEVLLTASDVLSDLVAMARAAEEVPAGFDNECRAALEQLINAGGAEETSAGGKNEAAPSEFEGFEFTPVRADDAETPADTDGKRSYAITFRPKPDMLKSANEPLFLLRELRGLGDLDLVAETDKLPPLSELQPDCMYLGWHGTLRTAATRKEIEDIFEFVSGDCELQIVETNSGSDSSGGAIDSASPEQGSDQTQTPVSASSASGSSAAPPETGGNGSEEAKQARKTIEKPAATTIRVDLERIDRVVNMVGELVIAQAMLGQVVQDLPEDLSGRLSQILEDVIFHTRELKDRVMSIRAQPVGSVFQRMPRLVRELSAKTAKKIQLEMVGEGTEVDKTIIERLSDPLTHIIRNSIDHGIELPADRLAAGKSEQGTIRLSAEHRGGRIVIAISDDGAGINCERVLKKAREKGLISADAELSDDEISNLIFLPGFSTAETVSDISGRGVGMDVVRRNIQDLGGRISLKSEPGRGMSIQLSLPLTLAVMDGMVIEVRGETYVLPMTAIIECLRPSRSDIHALLGTQGTMQLRGEIVPIVHLGDVLELPPVLDNNQKTDDTAETVVIIVDAGEGSQLGLVVDELCGHQQVVIKSIEENYGAVPGIAAATILGDGHVAFILDVERLSDLAAEDTNQVAGSVPIKNESMSSARLN